jgi:hypothetical protein
MRTARCVHRNCFFSGVRAGEGGAVRYKVLARGDIGIIRIKPLPTWFKLQPWRRREAARSRSVSHMEKLPKEKLSQYELLRRDQDALRRQFISAELDLALTFVRISQSTDDEERYERNLNHARKAVEVARKYLGETNLTPTLREELVEKLQN